MDAKERLAAYREKIDSIDEQMIALFKERMEISKGVGELKNANNMSILDDKREQQIADKAAEIAGEAISGEAVLLMRTIMALSKGRQRKIFFKKQAPLLPPPRKPLTENIVCAHQGVPGAWSEQALMKMYPSAKRQAVEVFEDVFLAVKERKADYGVVPIENSKTGGIGETYDLLRKYGCYIVGKTWIDIRHCLLAPQGVKLEDIREVYSHPEGFRQCYNFLRGRAWDLTPCRNTALAAEMAAKSTDGRVAAIGSRRAAELNNLNVLVPDIMDMATNRTAFVAIAAEPEYDETCDAVSVTFSTCHRSGALCETLMPFMAAGINLMRIESRPSTLGHYRFFVDLVSNIMSQNLKNALTEAVNACEYLEVIGCYHDEN